MQRVSVCVCSVSVLSCASIVDCCLCYPQKGNPQPQPPLINQHKPRKTRKGQLSPLHLLPLSIILSPPLLSCVCDVLTIPILPTLYPTPTLYDRTVGTH